MRPNDNPRKNGASGMNDRVLIVDDEDPVRRMVARLVQSLKLEPIEAGSGVEALARLEEVEVDLVITDLKMPEMDGLTLAKRLIEQDPDRPVMMMTAYADLASARKAIGIGIYDYFTKPFDIADVSAGIRRALEKRRLVLENQAYQTDLEARIVARTTALRVKIREMEARDSLLRQMLAGNDPASTLDLVVQLALQLCGGDAGVLHVVGANGETVVRSAVGLHADRTPTEQEALGDLGLVSDPEIRRALEAARTTGKPVFPASSGAVRSGYGLRSLGVFPVLKGDTQVACLEIGRREDIPVGQAEAVVIGSFLAYVALAVSDFRLQEDLPAWSGDVEEALKVTEDWDRT